MGYPVLGAFFNVLRSQRFFAIDLASLLIAYWSFIAFAKRTGVSAAVAATIFLLTVCGDATFFKQWIIPWTTSPAAAIIWSMLALSAAYLQGRRHPVLLGILAAALPAFRPTDALIGAICLAWLFAADLRRSRPPPRDLLWVAAGMAIVAAPYAALHLAIYGPHPSPYMIASAGTGFTPHNAAWRAYVLLLDPRQWFFEGRGILVRAPWLLLGIAGALTAWRGGAVPALLSACLISYCLLMLSYVDLLPTGLWRYYNIHYFKWTLPGFGLLAWFLIRDLRIRHPAAVAALATVLLLTVIRITPRQVGPNDPAVAVDLPGPAATAADTTMAPDLVEIDALGRLPSVTTMRVFPLPSGNGVRLIGLTRDVVGPVAWEAGHGLSMPPSAPGAATRWGERITLGYPCWLPPHPCIDAPVKLSP